MLCMYAFTRRLNYFLQNLGAPEREVIDIVTDIWTPRNNVMIT